jgi:hypothetical protein
MAAGFRRTHDLLVLTCSQFRKRDRHRASMPRSQSRFLRLRKWDRHRASVTRSQSRFLRLRKWDRHRASMTRSQSHFRSQSRFRSVIGNSARMRQQTGGIQAIFARTLIDSLDFPELRSTAPVSAVLARFAEAGVTGSRWWYLVERRGNPAGCLLMTDHPDLDRCELLYMGLAPECEGRAAARPGANTHYGVQPDWSRSGRGWGGCRKRSGHRRLCGCRIRSVGSPPRVFLRSGDSRCR